LAARQYLLVVWIIQDPDLRNPPAAILGTTLIREQISGETAANILLNDVDTRIKNIRSTIHGYLSLVNLQGTVVACQFDDPDIQTGIPFEVPMFEEFDEINTGRVIDRFKCLLERIPYQQEEFKMIRQMLTIAMALARKDLLFAKHMMIKSYKTSPDIPI
jgi:hypothetical protein